MSSKTAVKISFAFVAVLLIAAVIRIAYVNITATKPLEEHSKMNEWVALDGSFFRSNDEKTEGYSVKVTDYEIISKEDFLKRYKLENSSISEQNSFNYFMIVSVAFMNENNEDGRVMIADWRLVGKNGDFVTSMDPQILMDTDERINDYLSSVTTAPGKEISLNLTFPMTGMKSKEEIEKNSVYRLAVTKYPVRKYIYLKT